MNVLVLGSGGREHALVWKIAQSPLVTHVFVAPGNPGTAGEPRTTNVAVSPVDGPALVTFCQVQGVSLVVVGPETPLVAGVADTLRAAGILTVGPGKDGAELEGSKAFCKSVLDAAGVPTARWARVSSAAEIDAFVDAFDGEALVVKADGLAAGKGVVVCSSVHEARAEAHRILRERPWGDACNTLVLEERLYGIEVSYMVLTDGHRFAALPTSQDHKRLLDGDEGPNTGGMGAFSPATFLTEEQARQIESLAIVPTLAELRRRGIDYRGFLYAGIMLTARGPIVLEYNVRLGDPETQVLMAALQDDFVPALLSAASGALDRTDLGRAGAAAVVVLAAEGYPESPVAGSPIVGLEAANAVAGARVFHAGTRSTPDGIVVSGGRVLGVGATAATPADALAIAYRAVACIQWPGMQFRRDIGKAIQA